MIIDFTDFAAFRQVSQEKKLNRARVAEGSRVWVLRVQHKTWEEKQQERRDEKNVVQFVFWFRSERLCGTAKRAKKQTTKVNNLNHSMWERKSENKNGDVWDVSLLP